MRFQFCSSFLIVFIHGADSSDPQALAVWNGVGAMFWVAACWGEILVCIGTVLCGGRCENPFLYHNMLLCLVMAKSVPVRVDPFLPVKFGPPGRPILVVSLVPLDQFC